MDLFRNRVTSSITSARSSDSDMTICSTVLQGPGGGGVCHQLLLRRVTAITNRASCTDSQMMTLGNGNDLPLLTDFFRPCIRKKFLKKHLFFVKQNLQI